MLETQGICGNDKGRETPGGRSLLLWGDTGVLPLAPIDLTRSKPEEELFNPPPGPGWNRARILYIMGGRGKTWAVRGTWGIKSDLD